MSDTAIKCVACGRFIAVGAGHVEIEPDSHFGPEQIDWSCDRCYERDALKPYHADCLAREVPGATCMAPDCDCWPQNTPTAPDKRKEHT